MALTSAADAKAYMRTLIYENTTGDVSATDLQDVFDTTFDAINWTVQQRGTAVVGITPITVVLPIAMTDTTYQIFINGTDAAGDPIDISITNKTVNGFDLTASVSGSCDWLITA